MKAWHIGQEIVCVRSHSALKVVKGKFYTIVSLNSECSCNDVKLNVGILSSRITVCTKCRHRLPQIGEQWFSDLLFAPLADISELEEILEEEILTQQ